MVGVFIGFEEAGKNEQFERLLFVFQNTLVNVYFLYIAGNVPSSSSVDSTALKIHREADEVAHHELSTIAQSPLEAFYSSSSLDTSSDEEDPDQVRRLNSLTEADPHKETRDWLISRSLDSEEAKPRAKVVSYAKIIAKPEEEQSRLSFVFFID